jgi:hypothetical protein
MLIPPRCADLLRTAVRDALCVSNVRRADFPEAIFAIKAEMPLATYCKRIASASFWGGEPEIFVLATMLKVPITVYLPEGAAQYPLGYVALQTYGAQTTKSGKARRPVKLLYNGHNQCVGGGCVRRCVRTSGRACIARR